MQEIPPGDEQSKIESNLFKTEMKREITVQEVLSVSFCLCPPVELEKKKITFIK